MVLHKCDNCTIYETSRKDHMDRHKKTCCGQKEQIFTCDKCHIYETDRKPNLQKHRSACNIECIECNQKFQNKREHDKHFTKEHKRPICSLCGKEFGAQFNLNKHLKNQHNLTKTKESLNTSIGFVKFEEEYMDSNENNVSKVEKKHMCDVCGYSNVRKDTVDRHISRNHEESLKRKASEDPLNESRATKYRKLQKDVKAIDDSPTKTQYFERKFKKELDKVTENELLESELCFLYFLGESSLGVGFSL